MGQRECFLHHQRERCVISSRFIHPIHISYLTQFYDLSNTLVTLKIRTENKGKYSCCWYCQRQNLVYKCHVRSSTYWQFFWTLSLFFASFFCSCWMTQFSVYWYLDIFVKGLWKYFPSEFFGHFSYVHTLFCYARTLKSIWMCSSKVYFIPRKICVIYYIFCWSHVSLCFNTRSSISGNWQRYCFLLEYTCNILLFILISPNIPFIFAVLRYQEKFVIYYIFCWSHVSLGFNTRSSIYVQRVLALCEFHYCDFSKKSINLPYANLCLMLWAILFH